MKSWKRMGKRALASFLAFTLCLSMVNLAAFAAEEEIPNIQLPLPEELEMMEESYPWTLPYNLGQMLMEDYPKGTDVPRDGVWAAEGAWEDGTPVLTMAPDGTVTVNAPTGPEALVTVTYTYQKAVEKAPNRAPAQVVVPEEPSDAPSEEVTEEPSDAPSDEPTDAPTEEPAEEPSDAPADEPTDEPSEEPSEAPSQEPSEAPSQAPADEPSQAPADEDQDDDGVIIDDNPVPEAEGPEADGTDASDADETDAPEADVTDEPEADVTDAPQADETDEPEADVTDAPQADETDEPEADASDDVVVNEIVKAPAAEKVDVVLTWKVLFTSMVEPLGNGTLVCDASKIPQNSDFSRSDGNHNIYISGEWSGTLSFGAGTVHIYAGTGANNIGGSGTINASGRGRSAITVSGTAHVILHDGVTVKGGTGNYVSSWPQNKNYGHTVGGGVCIEGGTFTMYGGTIGTLSSATKGEGGNSAGAGGGVYVANKATFNMYGGNICNNKATGVRRTGNDNAGLDGGGGGIWVNGTAVINPTVSGGSDIKIQNNTSATKVDLGGGGIYVNNPASLSLINAIITENHADGLGGGIASCVHGKVGIVNIGNNGAAIYKNTTSKTAYDENGAPACGPVGGSNSCNPRYPNCATHWTSTTGDFVDAHSKWQGNGAAQKNFRNAATDIFCAGAAANGGGTIISDTRPIDSSAKWTGYVMDSVNGPFKQITQANNGYIYGGFLLGLTAGNTNPPGFSGHKVTISGNTSATHGGGIATNGILALSYVHTPGDKPKEEHTYVLDGTLPLNVTKNLNGASIAKNSFTFQLLDSTGTKVLDTATSDKNGKLTLDYGSGIDQTKGLNSSYTFYVREVANSNTEANTKTYKVTVPVNAGQTETKEQVGLKVYIHHYTVGAVSVEGGTGVGSNFKPISGNAQIVFNNTWKTGSLTLNKAIEGSTLASDPKTFTFRVKLTDPNEYGLNLNQTFSGYKFTNGQADIPVTAGTPVTLTGIPYGAHYSVEEVGQGSNWTASETVTGDITTSTATATITNKRNTTELSVTKKVSVDTEHSQPAPNDSFSIRVRLGNGQTFKNSTEWDGPGIYRFDLKAGQTATITGIPIGTTYTVTEDNVGDGWTQGTIENVSGTANGQTVIVNNTYYKVKTTNVEVTKIWTGTEPVMPESIKVHLSGGPDSAFRQGRDQELTANTSTPWYFGWFNLPLYDENKQPYTYSVEETEIIYPADSGYTLDDPDEGLIRVRGPKTVENKPDGEHEIMGAWVVTGGTGAYNDETGKTTLTLTNEWRAPGHTGDFNFSVYKIDSLTEKPIEGVKFTAVNNDDASKTFTAVTDTEGKAYFKDLPEGTYTLTETEVPAAYVAAGNVGRTWEIKVTRGDTLKSVEIKPGEVGTNFWNWLPFIGNSEEMKDGVLTVKNKPLLGSIQIAKALDLDYTVDGEKLDRTFTFEVYTSTGELIETLYVGPNTPAEDSTVSNLRMGTYIIKEVGDTRLPNYEFIGMQPKEDAYSFDSAAGEGGGWRVTVNEDQKTYVFTAVNSYKRDTDKLTITKTVNGNTTADEHANDTFTFTVTVPGLKDGTYSGVSFKDGVGPVELKAGGSKTIEGLPVGFTYTVEENASNGNYTIPEADAVKDGTIEANGANTAAFTNTRKNGSLTVGKLVDYDSTTSMGPNAQNDVFTITVKLGSGADVIPADPARYTENGLYTFTVKDKETKTISGIPTGTTYTVTETSATANHEGGVYTFSGVVKANTEDVLADGKGSINEGSNAATVKNHYYQPKYTSLTVTKDWTNTPNEFRQPITVTLVGGPQVLPEGINRTVELNAGNGWSYTWNNLPQYEDDGQPAWSYEVEENSITVPENAAWTLDYADRAQGIIRVRSNIQAQDNNYEIIGGWSVDEPTTTLVDAGSSVSLRNNWRGKSELGTASFSIHKIDAETNAPINGVTFTLKKEGSDNVQTYTTTDGELTISGLAPGKYSLTETGVAEGYRDDETNKGHEWILEFVQDNDHKDQLLSVKPVNENDSLGENIWSWKASSTDSNTVGEITITNEIIRGDIGVKKVLDLDGVTEGISEDLTSKTFNFNIYAGTDTTAEPVARLSVPANGKPVYAEGLRFGTYTIVEVGNRELDNYDYKGVSWDEGSNARVVTIDTQGQVVEVKATNHYTRHTTGLQLSKTVSGNRGEKDREWHFLVELKSPAAYVNLAESYWATVFTPNERVDEATGETITEYTREFVELTRYVAPAPEPDPEEPPAETADPAPTESAEPSTETAEEPVDTQTALFEVTLKHGQILKLGNLPLGTTYTVTEEEADEGSYRTTPVNDKGELLEKDQYTEVSFDNYWNYSYYVNTVDVSVQKVWRGDDENVRPTRIQVRLMNGTTPSGTVTLSENNGWSHTWRGLDENGDWSVEEVSVPEGYTVSVSGSGTSFTITNTYSNTTSTPTPTPTTTTTTTTETPEPTPSDTTTTSYEDEELLDDDVPLADMPHHEEEILEDDVPLADVPQTGDSLYGWLTAALASGLGLVFLTHKRKKEDEEV